MDLTKETQEKINQLQLLEQNLQSFMVQKQSFQTQLNEINSALSEIDKTNTTYKIVGNIMVLKEKDELKQDLESKKEVSELRIKAIEKQETKLKEKVSDIQKEVMGGMKD